MVVRAADDGRDREHTGIFKMGEFCLEMTRYNVAKLAEGVAHRRKTCGGRVPQHPASELCPHRARAANRGLSAKSPSHTDQGSAIARRLLLGRGQRLEARASHHFEDFDGRLLKDHGPASIRTDAHLWQTAQRRTHKTPTHSAWRAGAPWPACKTSPRYKLARQIDPSTVSRIPEESSKARNFFTNRLPLSKLCLLLRYRESRWSNRAVPGATNECIRFAKSP